MSSVTSYFVAFTAGAAIGVFYFGGLWWTVQRILTSPRPALWSLGSFLVRTSLSLAAFYMATGGHWDRILICLAAFILVRLAFVRRIRPALT